jgi:hypothetical protein
MVLPLMVRRRFCAVSNDVLFFGDAAKPPLVRMACGGVIQ